MPSRTIAALASELLQERPSPIARPSEPTVPNAEPNIAEISNIETRRVRGTFYRFHSKTHFHSSEDEFYKNFLETSRTFSQQARFAPPNAHSGFCFGSSKNVAIAEMAHYNKLNFSKTLDEVAPEEILHELAKRNLHKVFLSVELIIDVIVDFTDGKVVEKFLRHGRIGYRKARPEYWVQYVKPLVAKKEGGNDFTDVLGVDVKSLEYDSVLFPSVRALQHDADVPFGIRLREDQAQAGGLGSDSNIMELHWQLQEQPRGSPKTGQ